MIIDCVAEIRKVCLSFTDIELKKTFILCIITQLREDKVSKEKEKEILQIIANDI